MEYFILAILLIQVILPVLDGLTSLLLTIIETAKGYFGVKVAKYNNRIRDIQMGENIPTVNSIGFSYETKEEEDDDDL